MIKRFLTRFFSFYFLIFIFFLLSKSVFSQNKLEVYFFWGQGCPHCAQEKPFLFKLKEKYPLLEVKEFEVYYHPENQELFKKVTEAYKTSPLGVPMTFIGESYVSGFGSEETTGKEIEALIKNCLKTNCPSPSEILKGNSDFSLTKPPEKNFAAKVCIHYFVKDQCQPCENLKNFLAETAKKYQIDLKVYNVSQNKEDLALYQKLQEFYGLSFSGFPIVFLGNSYLVGDESIKKNIEKIIVECQEKDCHCPVEELKQTLKQIPKPFTFIPEEKEKVKISFLGKNLEFSTKTSLIFLGLILGLADGINPCMFSVLLFLLTYLLAIGSKKKAVKVGLVFVLGVFLIYFLFMLGMINLISLIGFIQKIKTAVAILALVAALIMIKDFFAYGRWFSLEIPKRTKPLIEKLIKKGTIPSAIILALFSSLVELPCTAGIPLIYTTLLAQKGGSYGFYLFWYNLFFVLPLILIIAGVGFAWAQTEKVESWRLSFRKYMRLLAGLILLFLGIALLKGIL